MRKAFVETLCNIASNNKNVWLLTGDLGYNVLDKFIELFPERFFNVGIAEQNMVGIAAGLALEGKTVFVYSTANFITIRCLEQIRNDVCNNSLDVKFVSVGGGFAYGYLGYSHHGIEDIAVTRSIFNLNVVAPEDSFQTEQATIQIARIKQPFYLRLGYSDNCLNKNYTFKIGKAIEIEKGKEAVIISTGGMLNTAVEISDMFGKYGVDIGVWSMPTVSPIDEKAIKEIATNADFIFTLEEHSIIGGLGSAVAEVLSGIKTKAVLHRCGINQYRNFCGDRKYMLNCFGLDAKSLYIKIVEVFVGIQWKKKFV